MAERGPHDETFLFQVELTLSFRELLPRPNQRDGQSTEWDERVADLQFRDRCEYAVGHGIAIVPPERAANGKVTSRRVFPHGN